MALTRQSAGLQQAPELKLCHILTTGEPDTRRTSAFLALTPRKKFNKHTIRHLRPQI